MTTKENKERISLKKLLGVFGANGSLHHLDNAGLVAFRAKLCNYVGLNPYTLPFRFYSNSAGEIFLYATKDACAQLRELKGISVTNTTDYIRDDVLRTITIKITGMNKKGRSSIATGSVSYENIPPKDITDASENKDKDKDKAIMYNNNHNCIMWAETKALRRLTLDLSGLGVLADVEVRDMQDVAELNVIPEEKEEGDVDIVQRDKNADKVANAINSIIINKK